MTSIERTAYPRLTARPSAKELAENYTPTPEELAFVSIQGRGEEPRLTRLALLKTFQCLGYFPALEAIPERILTHLRSSLDLPPSVTLTYDAPASLYRHHKAIREILGVKPYNDGGSVIAIEAIRHTAQVMNDPADMINAAIEELICQRRELPAFSALDTLAQRVRTQVNEGWYELIANRLNAENKEILNQLPVMSDGNIQTDFVTLKEPPGRPRLSEMRRLKDRLRWLESLGDTDCLLADVPPARIKLFAAEARALETRDIRDIQSPRRYTLLLCLLHQAKVETRDNLVEVFLDRMSKVHKNAKQELDTIREAQRETSERLVEMMMQIAHHAIEASDDAALGQAVRQMLESEGGPEAVFNICQAMAIHHGDNTLPLLWHQYANHHKIIFETVEQLNLHATSKDDSLLKALHMLRQHKDDDTLPPDVSLDFASERWQRSIRERVNGEARINRRQFEVCVFTYLANEFKSGDIAVRGAENYADYRDQLLSWEECLPILDEYCHALGFEANPACFVQQLKEALTAAAKEADLGFPEHGQLSFQEDGRPVLNRIRKRPTPAGSAALKNVIKKRMPQRALLDALTFVEHWVNYTHHFGPLSGSDPKIPDRLSRYIMTVFGYGCNLGPEQTAHHSRGKFTYRMLSMANRQHITTEKLEAAIRDVINYFNRFDLPRYWGTGQTAAADGTLFNTYLNNLMAERHIRYGEYGGVAFHHLSDTYIALFSHFITCGTWEAIHIIDGLLENTSDIQPDTLHADTQGQSLTVFGLAHLLGIQLMPRIRNWKDLTMYRSDKGFRYKHIDDLFTDVIDWHLIETHWQDLIRVVLSIRAGKLLPSMILRKLGNYSRKNRLYKAFRELGRVVRTIFLLRYISDPELRRQITATTNKIESFHRFIEWIFFGGHGVISINDPLEMEKRVKYNDLIANALIVLNVVDMTRIIRDLDPDQYTITPETLATLSPYGTDNIRRFGDFVIDLKTKPELPDLGPIVPNLGDNMA